MRYVLIFVFGIQFLFAQDFYPNRLLISLKPQASAWQTGKVQSLRGKISSDVNRLLEQYHAVKIERWLKSADQNDVYNGVDFTKIYRIYFQKSSVLDQAQKDFSSLSTVRLVEKEPLIKPTAPIPATIPKDPYFNRQWYLDRIMADYVWSLAEKIPMKSKPVLIGIVDTGIDYLHPEIGPALYVNPGEDLNGNGQVDDSDYNGIDDDGNGFVDDLVGWDFSMASDSLNGDNDIRPPSAGSHEILSHGTHVAGIAGAVHDNDVGISGIARHYKIIGTKHSKDDDYANGYLYNAYDGVLYAAKLGADVINCSWGGGYFSQDAQDLINMVAEKYGAIIVAAAGNDNNNNDLKHFYPSDLDNVVTVAALSPSDQKAYFSNFGHVIDISAPGQNIYSTIHYYKGGYASWQGTSMASPIVAGSFALLKAFFPDLTSSELVDRLLNAADPLDAQNPGYHHLLGSGRVNVYNAIAPEFLPGLKVSAHAIQLDDLNGNGQIDPGETIRVSLTLKNGANWQDAHQVKITASTSDSLISVKDNVLYLGEFPAGTEKTTDPNAFVFSVDSAHSYGKFSLEFHVTCNPDSSPTFDEAYPIDLLLSTYQQGFPWTKTGSLLPVSILHSSKKDENFIAFISSGNKLFVLDARGQTRKNFPVPLEEYHRIPPVIADLNRDGEPEMITVSQRAKIKVIDLNGSTLWSKDLSEAVYGNVAVADVDGDSLPEIVLGSMNKRVHVLDVSGNEKPGFPIDVPSFVETGVALGDVNGNGSSEIVFATFDRKLHCLNGNGSELGGWPVDLPFRALFTPVIAKDKFGIHIFIADRDKRVCFINESGQIEWDSTLTASVTAPPALGDVDGDGVADAMATFDDGKIRIISVSGKIRTLDPPEENVRFDLPPLLITADRKVRLIAGSTLGSIVSYDERFNGLPYSPVYLDRTIASGFVAGDLDGDGDLDVISANDQSISVLDLPDSSVGINGWTTSMGNNQRTGFWRVNEPMEVSDRPVAFMPQKIDLNAYPNPFNLSVKIKLRLKQSQVGQKLKVCMYDLRGRKLRTLFDGTVKQINYRWFWNGQNDGGKLVSSGIYFISIQLQDKLFGKQVLLIK